MEKSRSCKIKLVWDLIFCSSCILQGFEMKCSSKMQNFLNRIFFKIGDLFDSIQKTYGNCPFTSFLFVCHYEHVGFHASQVFTNVSRPGWAILKLTLGVPKNVSN